MFLTLVWVLLLTRLGPDPACGHRLVLTIGPSLTAGPVGEVLTYVAAVVAAVVVLVHSAHRTGTGGDEDLGAEEEGLGGPWATCA
jgi:hypothetical protein